MLTPRHSAPRSTEESISKLGAERDHAKKKVLQNSQNNLHRTALEQNSESLLLFLFLFGGMVQNGIPRVICLAEQPEFRQNKPFVSSTPSS